MPEPALHPAFVEILRAERESFNQRFALRQRAGARIDQTVFHQHLCSTVNELVAALAREFPERVRAAASALFDASLDLFAAGLLGPEARHPHITSAWRDVLPHSIRLLARDPLRIIGSLSNAVEHLAASNSGRPLEWIELMRRLAPECDSIPQWLDAGKVAAWRAGLVPYRPAALRLVRTLPWKLGKRCLGISFEMTETEWHLCLDRLEADCWFSPAEGMSKQPGQSLRIFRATGGFRGFGGLFLRPPTVTAGQNMLFATDGEAAWQVLADAFGTFWQRVPNVPATSGAPKIAIDARGRVNWNGVRGEFSELAQPSSFASDGQTLAVTLPTSHLVFLVARAGGP